MSGLVEAFVQNQSPLMLFTDVEQAGVLRPRCWAEREKATAGVDAGGTTAPDQEKDSNGGTKAETRDPVETGLWRRASPRPTPEVRSRWWSKPEVRDLPPT